MSYKALYRTYRPTTFLEVAGQKAIVRTLQNALSQNKIAHAYLFSGPRGTGKTSMAKLFAKALNCDEGVGHQCNKCINCQGINDGSHPDVYEIDAASNNGVDDVRQLIENINYAPIRGKYKVYIIDEVHMMTQSAFNALLKTLEEPPSNVIFILATTEPHKVIPTILSRCQRYNFSKVSDKDMSGRLKTILSTEGIAYDEDALDLLVSLADGGVRDALSMLDQVLAYADQKLNVSDVLALFALTSKLDQINLLVAMGNTDVEKVFTILNTLLDKGVDVRRLTADLLNLLKDTLIYLKTENDTLLLHLRKNEVHVLTAKLTVLQVNMMIENLLKAQADYRFSNDIKNIFEITLLKIISMLDAPKTEIKQAAGEPKELPKITPKPAPQPVLQKEEPVKKVEAPIIETEDELPPFMESAPRETVESKSIPSTVKEKEHPKDEVKAKPTMTKKVESAQPIVQEGTPIVLEEETLIKILTLADRDEKMSLKNEKWDDLSLLAMDAVVGEYAALLFDAQPYALAREILLLEFDFARSASYVNLKENQPIIQDIIARLLGRKIPVYALSHDQSLALTKRYRNISQIKQLPKVKNVTKELEGKY